MNDFERRIQKTRLAPPPEDLAERIFPQRPIGHFSMLDLFRRRISVGWASTAVAAMCMVAFFLGQGMRPPLTDEQMPQTVYVVEIVEAEAEQHDFDFTRTTNDFLSDEFEYTEGM